MLIRPATLADLPAMMAVERAAPQAAHWSLAQYEAALGDSGPHRVCLLIEAESVVESQPQLNGFVIARELDREWGIENIVVSIGARRQGLGARLLSALLDLARGKAARAVFLEVRESNHAARRLYEEAGFMHSATRPRYYRCPEEDAVLYRLIFL